ncbi:MAG: preprotein translocase subunit SecY [Dehalococcoidales bacterium]|nr:preprotein translocase subunit SecY [Dehalococcoidales bacterium]
MRQKQSKPRLLQAMLDAFHLPDLRRRILFTIGILVVFRFIAHVPLPGIDSEALRQLFQSNQLLGMLDMFSGGAMKNFSVAAMGVYPYITASIIMMLLVPIIPRLQALSQEGEAGRHRVDQITHWLVIPLGAVQAYGQLMFLQSQGVFTSSGLLPMVAMIISMIAGTVVCVWLGELITEYGIGNGISIIIFGGIVAGLWQVIGQSGLTLESHPVGLVFYVLIILATIMFIVVFTEAHRRIPVQYARSVFRGGRMYRQGGSTHIPLRVNSAGMIPLIFSMSLVMLPGVIATYFMAPAGSPPNFATHVYNLFNAGADLPEGIFYWVLYFLLTFGFTFFYTSMIFQQQDLPGTLQRQGGFVPGVRPGKPTVTYLNFVVNRITWAGALYLSIVAVMPFIARLVTGVQFATVSAAGLIIVVGVALDTMKQMEAQLVMRRYEGFIK